LSRRILHWPQMQRSGQQPWKSPVPYLTELQGVYTSANPEAQKKTL
jgi:hypothetical protein